jgi:FkbH-like protein
MKSHNPTHWVQKFDSQSDIFADCLKRSRLTQLELRGTPDSVRTRIWRNQPFELIATAAQPFLSFADLELSEITLSPYDDSFTISHRGSQYDVEIVSFEFGRLKQNLSVDDLVQWFASRLDALRTHTDAPILITNWLSVDPVSQDFNERLTEVCQMRAGVYLCDTSTISNRLGARLYDERTADLKGTNLSDAAILELGRLFGLSWISAAIRPRLKAIVVDLDETLYKGVLGEDGVDGIVVTEDHKRLQRRLLELRDEGLFLGLISRNEKADVDNLFAKRSDLAITAKDFSAVAISWQPKSESLHRICGDFRIAADAVLYIDDNVGELAQIAASATGTRLLLAKDAAETTRALSLYPGLYRFAKDSTAPSRILDIEAAKKRAEALSQLADPTDYLRSLDIALGFDLDKTQMISRMHDLSQKTNQFNLSLARLPEAAILKGITERTHSAILVSLKDRLSDSGVIAFIYAMHSEDRLTVEDLCISCRALGRDLEDAIVAKSLLMISDKCSVKRVGFRYKTGGRNLPALRWLSNFTSTSVDREGTIAIDWNAMSAESLLKTVPANIVQNVVM